MKFILATSLLTAASTLAAPLNNTQPLLSRITVPVPIDGLSITTSVSPDCRLRTIIDRPVVFDVGIAGKIRSYTLSRDLATNERMIAYGDGKCTQPKYEIQEKARAKGCHSFAEDMKCLKVSIKAGKL